MSVLNNIPDVFTSVLGVTLLILLYRSGVLKMLLKNNNGGNNSVKNALEALEQNHLHAISEKLDKIVINTEKEIYILEEIKEKIWQK